MSQRRRRRRRFNPLPSAPGGSVDGQQVMFWIFLAFFIHGAIFYTASRFTDEKEEKKEEEEEIIVDEDVDVDEKETEDPPPQDPPKDEEIVVEDNKEDETVEETKEEEAQPEESAEETAPPETEEKFSDFRDATETGGGLDDSAFGKNGSISMNRGRSARGQIGRRGGRVKPGPRRKPRGKRPSKSGVKPGPARTVPKTTSRRSLSKKAKPKTLYNRRIKAKYPATKYTAGVEAEVIVKLTVRADGKVARVKIIKSAGKDFDKAAIAAFMKHRYEPAIDRNGKAVATEVGPVIYRFRIDEA